MTLPAYDCAMPDFGDNLLRLRKRAGLTQQALAGLLGLKTPTPVVLWEGRRKAFIPEPRTIRKLAAALKCPPAELMNGVETEYDKLRAAKSVTGVRPTLTSEKKLSQLTSADTASGVTMEQPSSTRGGPDAVVAHDRFPPIEEASVDAEVQRIEEIERNLELLSKLDTSADTIRSVADALRRTLDPPATRPDPPGRAARHQAIRRSSTRRGRR